MKRFWEAMETGFAEGGPSYRLKEVLADDYPLYARYLEPAGRCAETYALAATGEELPLLPRGDGFLAPTESDEVLHLPLEEVEILRFRHARLLEDLCTLLEIDFEGTPLPGMSRAWRVGTYEPLLGKGYPVFWVYQFDEDYYRRTLCAIRPSDPALFFVPRLRHLPGRLRTALQRDGHRVIPLEKLIAFDDDLIARSSLDIILQRPAERLLRREGQRWRIRFAEREAHPADSQGMRYLARLLGTPNRPIACHELEGSAESRETEQAILDDRAREQLMERYRELQTRDDDEAVRREMETLLETLGASTGLAGRARSFHGEPEKCRKRVGNALRRAVQGVAKHHPAAGEYLQSSLDLGRAPCYRGEPWQVDP
jgi:hypothetical protein